MDINNFMNFVLPMGPGDAHMQNIFDAMLGVPQPHEDVIDDDSDMPPLEPLPVSHHEHDNMPPLENMEAPVGQPNPQDDAGEDDADDTQSMPDLQSLSGSSESNHANDGQGSDSDEDEGLAPAEEEQEMEIVNDDGDDAWVDEGVVHVPPSSVNSTPDNRRRARVEEDEDVDQPPARRQRTNVHPAPNVSANAIPRHLPAFANQAPDVNIPAFHAGGAAFHEHQGPAPGHQHGPRPPLGPGMTPGSMGFVMTVDANGTPILGPPIMGPPLVPGGPNALGPDMATFFTDLNHEERAAMVGQFGRMMTNLFHPPPEKDDPKRAHRLVEALEAVPEGLAMRMENIADLSDGQEGCAVCWDSLLKQDTAGFGASKEPTSQQPQSDVTVEASKLDTEKPLPPIVSLPCAHVFHSSCLIPWFSRPKHATCPTCRFDLDPEGLTRSAPVHDNRPAAPTGAVPPPVPVAGLMPVFGAHAPAPPAAQHPPAGTAAADFATPDEDGFIIDISVGVEIVNVPPPSGVPPSAGPMLPPTPPPAPTTLNQATQPGSTPIADPVPPLAARSGPQSAQITTNQYTHPLPVPPHAGTYAPGQRPTGVPHAPNAAPGQPPATIAAQIQAALQNNMHAFLNNLGGAPPGAAGPPPMMFFHPNMFGDRPTNQPPAATPVFGPQAPGVQNPQGPAPHIGGASSGAGPPPMMFSHPNMFGNRPANQPPAVAPDLGPQGNGAQTSQSPGVAQGPAPQVPFIGHHHQATQTAPASAVANTHTPAMAGPAAPGIPAAAHPGQTRPAAPPFLNMFPGNVFIGAGRFSGGNIDGDFAATTGIPMPPLFGRPGPTRPPREWTLPDGPGPSVRQRVEKRERELGLRCSDSSCGIGPSDEDPSPTPSPSGTEQIAIHRMHAHDAADRGMLLCDHRFHAACLVSAERIAGWNGEKREQDQVPVACPMCRSPGFVDQMNWESGVQALAATA